MWGEILNFKHLYLFDKSFESENYLYRQAIKNVTHDAHNRPFGGSV